MTRLNEEWTGDVVGRLHRINSTQSELAKRCGYTPQYLSMVLNGKKIFASDYAKKHTIRHIYKALVRIEQERLDGHSGG